MPLSADPKVNEDAQAVVDAFHKIFGPQPGYRSGMTLKMAHILILPHDNLNFALSMMLRSQ
jgi:hypothetical protein